jgi:hypothetical protein
MTRRSWSSRTCPDKRLAQRHHSAWVPGGPGCMTKPGVIGRPALADRLALAIEARKIDVLRELQASPLFEHSGAQAVAAGLKVGVVLAGGSV